MMIGLLGVPPAIGVYLAVLRVLGSASHGTAVLAGIGTLVGMGVVVAILAGIGEPDDTGGLIRDR